jgi:hypothetical protein
MRSLAVLGIVLIIVSVSLVVIFRTSEELSLPRMTLNSDPYPLSLGTAMLLVSLADSRGAPIENAVVDMTAMMEHEGMLPLSRRISAGQDGIYRIPIDWSMMGQWVVDVTASLPDGIQLQDRYSVFVYATPPTGNIRQRPYQSVSEINAALSNPRERRFVIPQGTQALILSGHGADVVPQEIRLSLSRQNVLVIQNDDIVDHTVGPFFIKSGETIRQEFNSAATYIGACSIRFGDQVSIIIED